MYVDIMLISPFHSRHTLLARAACECIALPAVRSACLLLLIKLTANNILFNNPTMQIQLRSALPVRIHEQVLVLHAWGSLRSVQLLLRCCISGGLQPLQQCHDWSDTNAAIKK